MRKKSALILLSLLSVFGFAFGAAACGETTPVPEVTINGFDVEESMQVNVGAVIDIEEPIVTDSQGVLLDCWTYVTDTQGNYVAVTAGSFTASNAGEYTITYVVRDSANNTYEKKTKVTVLGQAAADEEVTIRVDFEQFIVVGEETSIDAVCSSEDAEISYQVTDVSSGEELPVSSGKFVPTEAGVYEIIVATADGAASYKYNVYAEAPLMKGEVEHFGEDWEEKESFIGGKRQDWQIVSSAEAGLLDPYGREATFAKYTTTRQYIPLYINIREDVEYYEQLAKEGYTYVSMWIYMESEKPHVTISDRDPNGGFYRHNGPDLYPGEWAEFRLDLVTGKTTWYRSFVQCYDYYNEQGYWYLQVDNSDEWNVNGSEFWGNEAEITFYFTDIFAVKSVSMSVADGAEHEKSVKDSVNFNDVFAADFAMDYLVSYRGETTLVRGGEYTFTGNGEYVVKAIPDDFNLRGSKTFSYSVSDEHTLSATPVIKERAGESVAVSFGELQAAFADVNGITPTIDGYKVYFAGAEVPSGNGEFIASKDGGYTVEVKGVYTENGVGYTTYHEVPVDVWSTATKYDVIDVNYVKNIRAWDWDNKETTSTYGEYTVGGITDELLKFTAKGQSLTVYAKPMYSKAYYEALYQEHANAELNINVYFAPATEGKTTNFRAFYHPNKAEWFDKYNDQWQSYIVPLADFIALYDEVYGKYEEYKDASYGANTEGYQGTWLQLIGSQMGRTVYMGAGIRLHADEASVTVKSGTAFALKQNNDLSQVLDVALDGVAAEIVAAEVFFNGEWMAIDLTAFAPVWAGEYAFRFDLESADGVIYQYGVEASFAIGGTPFEATVDKGLHTLKIGETLDVGAMMEGEYEYVVEVLYAGDIVANYADALIDGAALASGSYTVRVYAKDGDGFFGKILYYTFTLDVWSEATKYAVMDMGSAYAIRAWDWDNKQTTATYGEYTIGGVTDEFVMATAKGQSLVLYAKPMYSKAYYEALYEQHANAELNVNVYFTPATEGVTTNFRAFYHPTKAEWFDKYNNQWQTYELSLAEYIALYDEICAMYDAYADAACAGGTDGHQGTWLQLIGSQVGRTAYVGASLRIPASETTVALASGKEFALGQDNDLTDVLSVSLDGIAAEIVAAEVFFNGEWVALPALTFQPVWAGEYAFRLQLETVDGIRYATAERSFQIGGESFEATDDPTVWCVQTGDQLSLSSLTDAYAYEIEIYDITRGVMTLVRTQTEKSIYFDGMAEGVYFVKVYAIAEGDFGRILYSTHTVNNLGAYGREGVMMEEFTAETYKDMFKSYQYTNNQYLTDTTVTTEIPAGNSGTFLKYEGTPNNRKEAMAFAMKPLYSQAFYADLVESGKDYTVKFDVWIENVNADCTRTNAYCYSWKTKNGADSFTTHGLSLALGQWHTVEISLDMLVRNMVGGEVKFFGMYIPYGGFATSDLVRMYVGNIRLEEVPAQWSASTLTLDMVTTYQYSSSQNRVFTSITTEIPEGGVPGTYIKWAQRENKEDVQLAVAPCHDKAYYEELLASGKDYKITYDVYAMLTRTEGCTIKTINTKLWKTKNDQTHTFATYGTIDFDAWHTVEVDLNYLVANWGNYRLFGICFTGNYAGYTRSKDFTTFYLGNIQLVEGKASGVATRKA